MEKNSDINALNHVITGQDKILIRLNAIIALDTLAKNGIASHHSIAPLNFALRDTDDQISGNAALALSKLATLNFLDQSSIYQLNIALNNQNSFIRGSAANALATIASKGLCDHSSLVPLSYAMRDPDNYVRRNAKSAHEWIKPILDRRKAIQEKNREMNRQLLVHGILENSITLVVPTHIDSDAYVEIVINIHNPTRKVIKDIHMDFSYMQEFFDVQGDLYVQNLYPEMELKKMVKIKSKYNEGTFPTKIIISGDGASLEKQYTIKVGGTEIY